MKEITDPHKLMISQRLRLARVLNGYSQDQLATAINVSSGTYAGWEAYGKQSRSGDIYELHNLLGLSEFGLKRRGKAFKGPQFFKIYDDGTTSDLSKTDVALKAQFFDMIGIEEGKLGQSEIRKINIKNDVIYVINNNVVLCVPSLFAGSVSDIIPDNMVVMDYSIKIAGLDNLSCAEVKKLMLPPDLLYICKKRLSALKYAKYQAWISPFKLKESISTVLKSMCTDQNDDKITDMTELIITGYVYRCCADISPAPVDADLQDIIAGVLLEQ